MTTRWRLTLAFATVYLVWGSTYLGIRYAIESIPPLLMAGTRFLVAGALLFAWQWRKTAQRPRLLHWRTALILGSLLLLCGNGGVTLAEQRVASGTAALLVTSEPLWIVILNWLRPRGTAPTARELAGVVLGFAGVVLLLSPQLQSSNGNLWYSLTIVGSALAWAAGSLYGINAPTVADRTMGNGMIMLAGGALMLIMGLATGEASQLAVHHITATSILAWVYLTLFGSLAAFSAYTFLMANTTPAKASTYAFINPLVAVLLGWSLAGEPLDARSVAAIPIIVGAVMLITVAGSKAKAARPENPCLAEALPELE